MWKTDLLESIKQVGLVPAAFSASIMGSSLRTRCRGGQSLPDRRR